MYKLAIKRPIATLMYVVTLIIFGFISFYKMPSALFPKVDFPIVTITTVYPGADPSTVESKITDKIEEAVSSVSGIDKLESISSNGISTVIITFFLEKDLESATNDVRDKISKLNLPKEAKKPLVSKLDIGAAPVIKIFLTAKNKDRLSLMEFVDNYAKPSLEKIIGVGSVHVVGYRDKEVKIYPDIYKLNKYHIALDELNNIIKYENVKLGGGKIVSDKHEIIIKTKADAKTIEEIKNIYIKDGLKLKDIADVKFGLSDPKSYASYNQRDGVLLEVQKVSDANTLDVIQKVKKTVPLIKEKAGDAFGVYVMQDKSPFIIHSIDEVKFDLIFGAILAVVIVFVFLRNIKITMISAISIPSSILGTIFLMDFAGYNLNRMTLIGLTLAIGIIIDDAVVVLENIYKKLEEGKSRVEAAFYGVKEIAFAVLAISAMLLSVFLPVSYMSGIVGKFFESFAMTVGFAIIISYTVALSLIPSISARVLNNKKSFIYTATENIFLKTEQFYEKVLKIFIKHQYLTITAVFLVVFASLSLFPKIGMDFIPKEDNSEFEVDIRANPNTNLSQMIKLTNKLDSVIKKQKEIQYTSISIGYNASKEINKAKIYVHLTPLEKRELSQEELIQKTRDILQPYEKEAFITVAAIPVIQGAGVKVPYQIVLTSFDNDALEASAKKLIKKLKAKKGFVDVDSSLEDKKTQYEISIKRDVASRYGINSIKIANLIFDAYSSDLEISYFENKHKQYNVVLRLSDNQRKSINDLKKLQIRAKNGRLVYLDGLIDIKEVPSQNSIRRFSRERAVYIYADLNGLDLGGAIKYTDSVLPKVLEKGVGYRYTGFAEEMGKTIKAFGSAIALSIILMYIILAILYESLIQPIIIMITVPLSISGVLLSLYGFGMHFSLFVLIGFMLLMGMVGKNGVLVVDFANMELNKGKNLNDALVAAGKERLRPILMTTFAMIFAMIPIAIAKGLGSEIKAPMGVAVIGGLVSSMILTLIVIPSFYKIFYKFDKKLRSFYEIEDKIL